MSTTELHTLRDFIQPSGMLVLCSNCNKFRIRDGDAHDMASWISFTVPESDLKMIKRSHGICPACIRKVYPEYGEQIARRSSNR